MLRSLQLSLLTSLLLVAISVIPSQALEPVNASRSGLALQGYDAVAYFEQERAVEGQQKFSLEWAGVTWRFLSAEHRDAFAANPERFAPQYGGYCAYAVAKGKTASVDPVAWTIADGKLYLNYSLGVRKKWRRDVPGHVAKADENWPKLLAAN
ncbi:MAG: YHS domain-containing (seleno)protein [Acidobacteriota bacterium]